MEGRMDGEKKERGMICRACGEMCWQKPGKTLLAISKKKKEKEKKFPLV